MLQNNFIKNGITNDLEQKKKKKKHAKQSSNVNEGIMAVLTFLQKGFTHKKHKKLCKRTKTKKAAFLCA